jgi:hypothetical protein
MVGNAEPCLTPLLAGDVMTGRDIDQMLPRPGDSTLSEAHAAGTDIALEIDNEHGSVADNGEAFAYVVVLRASARRLSTASV